jgi:cyclic lactone autoinducer peptide
MVMKKIKSFIQKHANVLASFAMLFSLIAVNSRCVCIYHQPKMPEEMKKLKND